MKSKKIIYVLLPLLLALAFAGGLITGGFLGGNKNNGSADKIRNILSLIDSEYVDVIDTDSLLESTIPDLLAKLDPHSTYIPASELEESNESLDGSFGGIGIVFNMMTDTATVVEIVSGGPAEKVGIMAGDRIVTINDSTVAGKQIPSDEIRSQLKGPVGTTVKLGIKRATSPKLLSFDITRGDVPVTSVDASYMISPQTGYIRINKFGKTTYMEFLNAMVDLKSKGAQKYILDLRGNSGGYMEPAILMANEFLPGGSPIVSTHGRTQASESSYWSDGTGGFQNEELIVVIDEGSASATEIFAGAIQDNDRGLIVGRRSFGKGLVQNQIMLPDNSALRLTIARYFTPSGRSIQKPYTRGANDSYQMEIYDRINHGEGLSADSVKLDKSHVYTTFGGREVYGGGGIMPDIYVIGDTSGVTSYYVNVLNAGLLHSFAFNYADKNRKDFDNIHDINGLLKKLPDDETLLGQFVSYAQEKADIPPRWYYINISRDLIVNQLKSLIASDILGQSALFEMSNRSDEVIQRAIKEIESGKASYPIVNTLKEK
ncbi:MAG: S41 family peptidase [Paramuribaculum sp.]|nr:S41 family peptidase [Paramuribaculum sp.]